MPTGLKDLLRHVPTRLKDLVRHVPTGLNDLWATRNVKVCNWECLYETSFDYLYRIPVVPARGGAEAALGLIIRPFSNLHAPCAVRACFARTCCAVAVQERDRRATTLQCNIMKHALRICNLLSFQIIWPLLTSVPSLQVILFFPTHRQLSWSRLLNMSREPPAFNGCNHSHHTSTIGSHFSETFFTSRH